MPMGPAEIVASLKELCESQGPQITTAEIVRWIETHHGYESNLELVAFAKKMKARQYARMLMFDDSETGRRIKRLWSYRDQRTGERAYHDILQLPDDQRRRLIQQYATFLDKQRTLRRVMSDFFAGQQFFEFYGEEVIEVNEEEFVLSSDDR